MSISQKKGMAGKIIVNHFTILPWVSMSNIRKKSNKGVCHKSAFRRMGHKSGGTGGTLKWNSCRLQKNRIEVDWFLLHSVISRNFWSLFYFPITGGNLIIVQFFDFRFLMVLHVLGSEEYEKCKIKIASVCTWVCECISLCKRKLPNKGYKTSIFKIQKYRE